MLWNLLRAAFQPRLKSEALIRRALELREQGCLSDAERILRQTLAKFPRDAVAITNLALVLLERNQGQAGVDLLQRALRLDPGCGAAYYNLANVLRASGRLEDAIDHYTAATLMEPRIAPAAEELMHTLLEVCNWDRAQIEADKLRALVTAAPAAEWMRCVSPLTAAYLGLDAGSRKEVARYHADERSRGVQTLAPRTSSGNGAAATRMRIGYLSRDFRDHPVGHLIRAAFTLHDRGRFEVFAFSHGPDDGSVDRAAIAAEADHFVDVANDSDEQAANKIAGMGVDLLIDLAGHTTGNRLGVLARRPAPVQAHYLGYPGTTGASYLDYFITDLVATPTPLADEFTEHLAYMPCSYMVSSGAEVETGAVSRAAHRLPESAMVFCNFANSSRVTRAVFGLWMEILRAVPLAVLWLKGTHALTVRNLREEARRCAVDPDRLVFAPRLADKRSHVERIVLADLALDTIGWYNGHSSTSDMLWAGVPVLTAPGETFASRVAASLLCAADVPELVVPNARDYVQMAIQLGNDRASCAALKRKLAENRHSAPFFDPRRTVADLETVYEQIWSNWSSGQPPHTRR